MLGPPGAGIICGLELLIMGAEQGVNLGLLEEQYTLLPTEPFLQPLVCLFKYTRNNLLAIPFSSTQTTSSVNKHITSTRVAA